MSSISQNSCMGSREIGHIFPYNLCNLRVPMIYSYQFMHTQHDLDRNKNVLDISKPQLYGFKRNKAYFSNLKRSIIYDRYMQLEYYCYICVSNN